MGLHSVIVVSDGYHIYRVKKMLESIGLEAFGSPRKERPSGAGRLRDQKGPIRLGRVHHRERVSGELRRGVGQ